MAADERMVHLIVTPHRAHHIMICIKLSKELFALPPCSNVNTGDFGPLQRDLIAADVVELEKTLAEQLKAQKPKEPE